MPAFAVSTTTPPWCQSSPRCTTDQILRLGIDRCQFYLRMGTLDYPYPHCWFIMANLSYWTLFYALVYLTLSLTTSLLVVVVHDPTTTTTTNSPATHRTKMVVEQQQQQQHQQQQLQQQLQYANFWIRATWVFYLVAAVHGLLVVVLFWSTEYSPYAAEYNVNNNYITVLSHGVSCVVVILDGWDISKIPVRLQHYLVCLFLGLLFVTWSLVQQGLVPVDNPYVDVAESESEALYEILDWKEDPLSSAIVCVVVLLVVCPLFTLLFWALSFYPHRRYAVLASCLGNCGSSADAAAAAAAAGRGQNHHHRHHPPPYCYDHYYNNNDYDYNDDEDESVHGGKTRKGGGDGGGGAIGTISAIYAISNKTTSLPPGNNNNKNNKNSNIGKSSEELVIEEEDMESGPTVVVD